MLLLKNFYKKFFLLIITLMIILSIILSHLSGFFIFNQLSPVMQVNKEKICPEILQLNYEIAKKKQEYEIKNILSQTVHKNEYEKYLFQQVVMKVINESLLKQYANKIHLHMLNKYAKNIIYYSKYFQENNQFSYSKYFKFINFIAHTNDQYIYKLNKKIAAQYLIKILLKSIIILKSDIKKELKEIINRKNVQQINFKINKKYLQDKNYLSKIKKYFYLHKKKFFNPESFKIKIICLKKKNKLSEKINKKNKKLYCNYNLNKHVTKKKYNYHLIHTNSLNKALNIIHNLKNTEKNIKNKNKNLVIKIFNSINLGWINKENIPFYIKKFKLKKEGDCSNIIAYKNNFFIFKLHAIKKPYIKNSLFIKNYIKKKMIFNHILLKKMIINKKMNYLLKNKHLKLEKIISNKIKKIQISRSINYKKVIHYSCSSYFNEHIKKNFFYKKNININPSIRIYKNKNNHIYLSQINSYKSKHLQKKKIIYKKILNVLQLKKIKNRNYLYIKNFLLKLYSNKKDYLKKKHIYINYTQTISNQDNQEIIKIIQKLPVLKNNHCIYFLFPTPDKNKQLIIFKKTFFKKINKNEKKILIQQIKKYFRMKILTTILKNLYKKSKITYK